jgi:hypothetical protein
MYSRIVIIDMESMEIIYRDNSNYSGPVDQMKPHRSPLQSNDQASSATQQAAAATNQATAQGTDSQFEGPVQNSPYYKSMVASTADSTSDAYQNAQAASAQSANQAGFGQSSPIGQAASREMVGQEAKAQAQIPAQAMQATAPLALQAAGQTAAIGANQNQTGLGYSQAAGPLEEEYDKRDQEFQDRLWNIGSGVLTGGLAAL